MDLLDTQECAAVVAWLCSSLNDSLKILFESLQLQILALRMDLLDTQECAAVVAWLCSVQL
jgi:hypothetical protein